MAVHNGLRHHACSTFCFNYSFNLSRWINFVVVRTLQDCVIPPCGNGTHPGFWDVPMVALQSGQNGSVCSMADSCLK
jgi:hypothetical protein